jgi:hypothetical protein
MNPNPAVVPLNIHFISAAGLTPLANTQITIPPGGQVAKLGSELFPNVSGTGWVYAENAAFQEIQAFWLNYNAEVTSLDGSSAASAETIGTEQVIPLVAGQTEINMVNPNLVPVTATIRLFGTNGQLGTAATRSFTLAAALQAQLSQLFPSVDLTQARYVRVTASQPMLSSAVIRNYLVPTESLVVDAVTVTTNSQLTFPHVITGNLGTANYTTILSVTNVSTSSQTITIVFNPDSGAPVTITRTLEAGASLRDTAQNLLGLSSSFQGGWLKVTGTGALTGFAAYADTVGGGLSGVPATTSRTRLFFSHIADGAPQWQTGLALLNATTSTATVSVYAVNPSGTLIGGASTVSSARFTLEPGKRVAKVIHDLIPQTLGVNGGFVFISSDVEVDGIELFYTQDLKVLANVAPGTHLGAAFVPPLP